MMIKDLYEKARTTKSDINEHIPFLYRLANTCNRVTEFGTGHGVSTSSFLYARPTRFVSYDIVRHPEVNGLLEAAKAEDVNFEFRMKNILQLVIEPTDLLFIDDKHAYAHVKLELLMHAPLVEKYIAFHDTETFGFRGEDNDPIGIWPAVAEFLREQPQWRLLQHYANNNGLTVLMKVG